VQNPVDAFALGRNCQRNVGPCAAHPLPPACPELNSAENIWQYLRQTYLGNRVFADYTAILDARQDAWRKLLAETGRITSIAQRNWATIGQSL
jgi:transposase